MSKKRKIPLEDQCFYCKYFDGKPFNVFDWNVCPGGQPQVSWPTKCPYFEEDEERRVSE